MIAVASLAPSSAAALGLSGRTANLLFTVASLAVVVALWWGGRRVADEVRGEFGVRLVDMLLGLLLLGLVVAEGGTLVYIWNVESRVAAAVSAIGNPIAIGARGFVSLALVVVTYVGAGVVRRAIRNLTKRRDGISDHEAEIAFRLVQVGVYSGVALVLLGLWNVDLSGILIGAGFLGIVLGMAARQTLGAMLAGFVLMFARPFEIGDWVQIGGNEGIVTEISIVNTRIQTFDGEYVMLPNDYVGRQEVVNRSRKGRLRLHVEVGVDYDADPERAAEIAEDAVTDLDAVLSVPRPQAVLASFGDSAVTLDVRFWIDKPSARRKWRAHSAVVGAIHEAFDERDIKIPFPQREVSARPEAEGFRVRGEAARARRSSGERVAGADGGVDAVQSAADAAGSADAEGPGAGAGGGDE